MQSKKSGQPSIVQQDIALDTYLKTLLEEIPDQDIKEAHSVETQLTNKLQQPQIKKATETKPEKTVSPDTAKTYPISVMPDWTQQEFQAIYFRVDQLILAAPLTALLRTIKIEKMPTKIPGQPSWFMGLLDTQEQRIGTLDTGQLVLGKTKGQQRNHDKTPFTHILITHDGKWGLACDEILSIRRLEPTKVRWRTQRNKRPWLIGTVIDELTAIIDVNYLVPHRSQK